MSHDVLTFGEGMLRLSVPPGTRLENASSFDVHPAGAEANVATALAGLGLAVAWHSIIPDTPLGRRLSGELARHGVDLSLVRKTTEGRMGTYFVELAGPPRHITVTYDRKDSTATRMNVDTFPWEAMGGARLVYVSGITPAISDSCRELTLAVAERAVELEKPLVLDVNYRAKLCSVEQARATMNELSGKVGVLIVNREDARDVFGITGEPEAVINALKEAMATHNVVLSLGEEGSFWSDDEDHIHVPPRTATTIDRIGAGDAFAAGVIAGYLERDLGLGVEMGTVMAGLALGTHGDFLTTTRAEVMSLLEDRGRSVER